MPHVSAATLGDDTRAQMRKHIAKLLFSEKHTALPARSLGELLTETEEVMLAKRLCAVLLVIDGASTYELRERVGISTSTAARISDDVAEGAYRSVEKMLRTQKHREKICRDLQALIEQHG